MRTFVATVWDDGLVTDLQLLDVLKQNNARASFAFSPGVYGSQPQLNDARSARYGYRLAATDLLKFQDHDICNHTFSHAELPVLTRATQQLEIRKGREDLQRMFQQDIRGFVYPYGCWNRQAEKEVRAAGHTYSRLTLGGLSPDREDLRTGRMLCPAAMWYSNIAPHLFNEEFVLLSGHSYEIDNWEQVDRLYRYLKSQPDLVLCTMTELAVAIQVKAKISG